MKIEWRTAGVGATYNKLADDADGDMISGWAPEMVAQPQVTPLARSTNVKVHGRGNRQWSAALIIDKVHAAAAAALEYRATHPATLPDLVDLKITLETKVTYLTRAALAAFGGPPADGKTTLLHYQWIAEDYTATAPA